ncbi:MAG: PfkB family carbohydrate kinase [Paracoccaceae bacterium]
MTTRPDILCIGSVLWDVIGRSPDAMPPGADMPGQIRRQPGGVAMNIATALRRHGLRPALLSVVGRDAEGEELIAAARAMGLETSHIHRCASHPTDRYIAVEDAGGLVAAIADARALEAAGDAVLAALADGRLGSAETPYAGLIALDGNLTEALLADIPGSPLFAAADLRLAPASPGKALRLRPLLGHPRATFYVNLAEAGLLCGTRFEDSATAAAALHAAGAARALVTDGPGPAAEATPQGVISQAPPRVGVTRVTGAGDSFMAAHIAADRAGAPRVGALGAALAAAARHVSGD